MKPIQQDDIQSKLNEPNREYRFIHKPTKQIVRATNKSKAINKLKSIHKINATRVDVRQAHGDE